MGVSSPLAPASHLQAVLRPWSARSQPLGRGDGCLCFKTLRHGDCSCGAILPPAQHYAGLGFFFLVFLNCPNWGK